MSNLVHLKRQREKESKHNRACTDLFYLLTHLMDSPDLGRRYNLFSDVFHKPICSWLDQHKSHPRVALFAPRFSYKSTLEVAEIIQEILTDPNISIFLIHHKLDYARELVEEVAWHLQKNPNIRELLPANNRPRLNGNWVKTSNGGSITLPNTTKRHATLSGTSVGQDFTSTHPDVVFLDDVISEKTIEEQGGVEGVRNWVQRTITALVGATGKIRVKGTTWSNDDWYHDIMKSDSGYVFQKRAILETNNIPDWKGKPIHLWVPDKDEVEGRRLLTIEDVERYKRDAKAHFAGQFMNDPQPEGTKPWSEAECENFVSFEEVKPYLRQIVILSDPAPLGMDQSGKMRAVSGDKNYWANAVIGYCRNHKRTVRVLLDGSMSQTWSLDAGLKEIKRLCRKWKARVVGIEETRAHGQNAGLYGLRLKDICNAGPFFERVKVKPVTFKSTQRGKAPRIMDLMAMAKLQDFVICTDKTMNQGFLSTFLDQARSWAGKDSIPLDDVLDSVAYLEDPAILEATSLGPASQNDPFINGPLSDDTYSYNLPPLPRRTRYCGI